MANQGALESIIADITVAFAPLVDAAQAPPPGSGVIALGLEVGVDLSAVLDAATAATFATSITNTYNTLLGLVEDPSGFGDKIPQALQNISDLKTIITTIDALLPNTADLALKLFNYLVYTFVEREAPALLAVLTFGGVFKSQSVAAAGSIPAYVTREIDWEQFPKLLSPGDVLHDLYGWGTANLDSNLMLSRIEAILWSVGIPSTYQGGGSPGTDGIISLFWGLAFDGVMMPLGIQVGYLAPGSGSPGLSVVPTGTASFSTTIPAPAGWQLTVGLNASATAGYGLSMLPGSGLTLGPVPGQPPVTWSLTGTFGFARTPADGESKIVLFGPPDGAHLEATTVGFKANLQAGNTKGDAGIEFDIVGGKAVISATDADGFLKDLLPPDGISLDFDFGLGWSKSLGLYFTGNAGMEASFPLHISLGPISVDTVYLNFLAKGTALNLEASVSAEGTLGPISASVEKIGFVVAMEFQHGELDFSTGFKAPSGLGLDIEASAVSGGGFISFDTDKGEYSGLLELTIEMLQLKAFGLLDTKPEVSFVIIISADFPPIELGFGFSLTGVGGLLGVHRTLAVDPLRAAFRAHTIDGTLFLKDPASQGAQVAQNVAAIFPAMHGHFVFGPMVQISWGVPILVSADIGIIITLPDPIILVILGAIVAALPDPDEWIILINLDVMGVLDFDARTISIDASLYDSYILAYTLSGDMAFRLNYGENPSFALSVGGLHPRFQPPPGFPSLKRLTISLGDGSNPRLSVAGYFAITANSLQFGAAIDLYAEAGGFGVQGNMSFDVLIVFNPFAFTIDLHASVDLMSGSSVLMSIHLDGTLSGPAPWHLQGSASVSILFFSVSVNVNATFGQNGPNQSVPTVTVIDKFTAALNDSRNWKAELPTDAGRVATLASIPASKDLIIVHPIGQLTFRQTIVPLDVPFTKFGNATPSDAVQFSVTGPVLNGKSTPLNVENTVRDEFADGQFFSMSDQDKLSKPSFTPHDSGATFGLGALTPSLPEVTEPVQYITIVRDDVMNPTRPGKNYTMLHETAMALAGHGASALSPRRRSGTQKYVTTGLASGVTSTSVLYVVVSTGDLSLRADISPSTGDGYTNVQARLAAFVSGNPLAKNSLQIVPLHELPSGAGS